MIMQIKNNPEYEIIIEGSKININYLNIEATEFRKLWLKTFEQENSNELFLVFISFCPNTSTNPERTKSMTKFQIEIEFKNLEDL